MRSIASQLVMPSRRTILPDRRHASVANQERPCSDDRAETAMIFKAKVCGKGFD